MPLKNYIIASLILFATSATAQANSSFTSALMLNLDARTLTQSITGALGFSDEDESPASGGASGGSSGSSIFSRSSGTSRTTNYLMYTYDDLSPLGFATGRLTNGQGNYMKVKLHPDILTYLDTTYYTIDNSGTPDGNVWDVFPTGETKKGDISIAAGLTFKINNPIWGYVGGGVGFKALYVEVDEKSSATGSYQGTEWVENSDESGLILYPEAGIIARLADTVHLQVGVFFLDALILQAGIGFEGKL